MNLKQAVQQKQIDRFEMMTLAEQIYALNMSGKGIDSVNNIDFEDKKFVFLKTINIKKKEVLLCLSNILMEILVSTDKRLTSIFINHYLACLNNIRAYKYLPKSHRKPILIACGGLSGSGKSRIAREIAPLLNQPFGAIIIRDDIVRKQLANVSFDTSLDDSYYTQENEKKVYREMRKQAKHALEAGHTVILDALFYDSKERKNAQALAEKRKIHFEGFWMTASLETRAERVQTRLNNPSDIKTQRALQEQLSRNTGVVWWQVINTEGVREKSVSKAMRYLKKYL